MNRLEFLENKLGDTVISSYDYSLDLVGNRRAVLEDTGRLVEYDYDALYRLTEEKISNDPQGDNRTIGYRYDDVGNREIKDDSVQGVTSYVYDDNDLLRTETLVKDGVTVYSRVYDYDDNGNTVSRVENGTDETVYGWDFENRLVEVVTADGDVITYVYNAEGIRVSATVNGVTTEYLVDSNLPYAQVLEEYVDGELIVRYVYGHDLISQQRSGEQSVYQVDGLGSTRVITDEVGEVTDTYNYEAFGSLINSTGETENKYLFAGEQFDESLDQYYLRARFYEPENGRFTRRDTYEGRISEPITLHKYLYANANPVNYKDPTGFFSVAEAHAAASIGNILNEIQWEAGARILATAGGEEPTPLDLGFETLFAVGVGVAAIPLLGWIVSQGASLRRSVGKFIQELEKRDNFLPPEIGGCDKCAKALRSKLRKNGIPGRKIRVETIDNVTGTNSKTYIYDVDSDILVTEPGAGGFHEATIININGQDYAFDRAHPEGKPMATWLNDLETDDDSHIHIVADDPF